MDRANTLYSTYGIKAYNDTVYSYCKFAYYMSNGCRDQIDLCDAADQSTLSGQAICTETADLCRDNVEVRRSLTM